MPEALLKPPRPNPGAVFPLGYWVNLISLFTPAASRREYARPIWFWGYPVINLSRWVQGGFLLNFRPPSDPTR